MRHISPRFSLSASALAASMLVIACGGGGANPPSNAIPGSNGFAVDDYLEKASVVCDSNNNGVADAGEQVIRTGEGKDNAGFFQFDKVCSANLVVTGGTNLDTGLPFTGKLIAPVGSTMVTPLTTLMAYGMTQAQVNTALGLPLDTELTKVDPARKVGGVLQNADLFRKTLAIQQLIQKTAETLANVAGAGASGVLPTIYSEVAASVAESLRANLALVSGGVMNEAAVAALVQAATARVQTTGALSTEIKAGASAVNAGSLAQVVAGAITKQANAILQATDAASITAITQTVQGDASIAAFALQNKTALAAPPSTNAAALAALATTLTQQVPGGITPPPPPPPVAGTLIVSFDEATLPNLGAFGDAAPSVATPPAGGGTGAALKLSRSGSQVFGGTFFDVATAIPFAANRKTVTARVYSTRANALIFLKVEGPAQAGATQVSATTGAANTWQTLTWVLNGVDPAISYKTVVFSADTDVANVGAQTYWIDDVALADAPVSTSCSTAAQQCLSFSESTLGVREFGGLVAAAVADDPVAGASNKVLKLSKGPVSEAFAGAVVYTMKNGAAETVDEVGLNTSKIVTVRSYSGAPVGTKITLKLENGNEPAQNIAAETVTTKQNEWETLTFNFDNLTTGVFSSSVRYNTVVLFPAFVIGQADKVLTLNTDFFFDELKYAVAISAPPPPPPPPPPAPGCTAPTCVDFSGAGIGFGPFENGGGGTVEIAAGPIDANNKAVKFVKKPGDGDYFGTTITGLGVSPVLTASAKTITMRVYSPNAGTNFLLKLEGGTGGPATTEKDAVTTVAGAWETLSFDMPDVGTYSTIVVFPNGRSTVGADKTMYIDDLKFPATSGGSGGGGGTGGGTSFVGGIFSSDYTGSLADDTAKSEVGGSVGFFYDERLLPNSVFNEGGVSGNAQNPGGVPNFFFGLGKVASPQFTDAFFGGFVQAPGNTVADASGFAKIKLKFWGDAETWEKQNFTPMPDVILQGPANAACTNPSGRPEIQKTVAGQKIGAGSEYTIAKTEFTLVASCGGLYTIDSVWANVGVVAVRLSGTSIQYVNSVASSPVSFPTFINVGPISFTN